MLSTADVFRFKTEGFLVLEDVVPLSLRSRIEAEYTGLLDALYAGWVLEGLLPEPDGLDFWGKLRTAYEAGCDWFQPMDISLPGDTIHAETPMHFGPAVFDLVTCPEILDVVQSLIGPEITSNPIQHIRIKPPAPSLRDGEIRAHITRTDWHQDRGVGHAEADRTDIITVWIAMTDATVENGCLQVIPRSHDRMLPHCPKVQTAIADDFIEEAAAIALARQGGWRGSSASAHAACLAAEWHGCLPLVLRSALQRDRAAHGPRAFPRVRGPKRSKPRDRIDKLAGVAADVARCARKACNRASYPDPPLAERRAFLRLRSTPWIPFALIPPTMS